MDIRTLPEAEREIYNRIKKKYKLTFDRLKIGDSKIRLLKIGDLEEFLGGKDPFATVSDFPFWTRLWDAAMVLAYVLGGQKRTKGRRLLELRAGLGAPGLSAAAAGFDVTLADEEDIIMDFQKVSAAASGITNVTFARLDWQNPLRAGLFDVLAGAELLSREDIFQPLLRIFSSCLKPDGEIYLAHDERRQTLFRFLELAQDDFEIGLKKQILRKDGNDVTIIINRLRPKRK